MERINVGFIGCGGITRFHFGHFEKLQEKARVAAVCDLQEDRAKAAAERFPGAKAYTDYTEMLKKERLDAVYVCVPPFAHDGMEMAIIERGINLFCQKPMALDMKYCRKVWNGIKKHKLVHAAGLQCRYVDSWEFLRPYLQRKIASNDLAMFSGYRLTGFPLVWWWRQMELSGGQVVEQSIHNYDLLRYFLGEVEQVQAVHRRGVVRDIEGFTGDDASCVLMTFKNGVVGTFSSACISAAEEHNLNFYYRRGKMSFDIFGNYTITEPNRTITGKAGNDFGMESDETFVDVVRGELDQSEILTPYDDAMKSLELTLAVNESMANGGMPIRLS